MTIFERSIGSGRFGILKIDNNFSRTFTFVSSSNSAIVSLPASVELSLFVAIFLSNAGDDGASDGGNDSVVVDVGVFIVVVVVIVAVDDGIIGAAVTIVSVDDGDSVVIVVVINVAGVIVVANVSFVQFTSANDCSATSITPILINVLIFASGIILIVMKIVGKLAIYSC